MAAEAETEEIRAQLLDICHALEVFAIEAEAVKQAAGA
jgi:hypothetical protein